METAIETYDGGHRAMGAFARSALSELRIKQGRLDDAERLLANCTEHPAACPPTVRLCLERGDHRAADAILSRRIGDDVPTLSNFGLFDLRVDVAIALGDHGGAARAAATLADFAKRVQCAPLSVTAELAAARVLAARGDHDALVHLEKALELSVECLPFQRARARAMVARLLAAREPSRALIEATSALRTFEELGAAREANGVSELLQRLSRSGTPQRQGLLSKREEELLPLLAAGLSNPEIGSRLFVSAKTVEHHVSSILSKLGLRNRAEAAAWATRREGSRK